MMATLYDLLNKIEKDIGAKTAKNPNDQISVLEARLNFINNSGMSAEQKQKARKELADDYLSIRAAEGLTDQEMQDILQGALGQINQTTGAARVGANARLARAGIKPTSGLASSRQAAITKGEQIAKGKARVAAENLDKQYQNQAMGNLLNIQIPEKKNILGQILGTAARVGAAYFTGGASEGVKAAANTAAGGFDRAINDHSSFGNAREADYYGDPYNYYRKNQYGQDIYAA